MQCDRRDDSLILDLKNAGRGRYKRCGTEAVSCD